MQLKRKSESILLESNLRRKLMFARTLLSASEDNCKAERTEEANHEASV